MCIIVRKTGTIKIQKEELTTFSLVSRSGVGRQVEACRDVWKPGALKTI